MCLQECSLLHYHYYKLSLLLTLVFFPKVTVSKLQGEIDQEASLLTSSARSLYLLWAQPNDMEDLQHTKECSSVA